MCSSDTNERHIDLATDTKRHEKYAFLVKLRTTREDFDRKVTSLSGNMVRLEVQGQSSSFKKLFQLTLLRYLPSFKSLAQVLDEISKSQISSQTKH